MQNKDASSSTLHMNRSMTKHQATAVITLREQVTGEWRPDSRGQRGEAKAKATIFWSSRCLRGRGQSSRTPSLPISPAVARVCIARLNTVYKAAKLN